MLDTRCSGAALAKVREGRIDCGWIVILLRTVILLCCGETSVQGVPGTGYLSRMMGMVHGSRERLKRMEEGLG